MKRQRGGTSYEFSPAPHLLLWYTALIEQLDASQATLGFLKLGLQDRFLSIHLALDGF